MLYRYCFSNLLWKVRVTQHGLELNGTRQFMFSTDDANLLGENINTVKKNTEALLDARKEVGLEVNTEKTMCMFVLPPKC